MKLNGWRWGEPSGTPRIDELKMIAEAASDYVDFRIRLNSADFPVITKTNPDPIIWIFIVSKISMKIRCSVSSDSITVQNYVILR